MAIKKHKKYSETSNWSDLPPELVDVISRKIHSIQDFTAFRSVCTSWRSTVPYANFDGTRQLPWLLQVKDDRTVELLSFADLRGGSSSTVYKPKVLGLSKSNYVKPHYCLGWRGWVLVVDKTSGNINLRHVFAQTKIDLPPLSTLGLRQRIPYVLKVALSSNPLTTPSDFTLMMICKTPWGDMLALWRPGDAKFTNITRFTKIRNYKDIFYEDIIFYDRSFYVLTKYGDKNGDVLQFDDHNTSSSSTSTFKFNVVKENAHRLVSGYTVYSFLVESDGDILIVLQIRSTKFRVFKFMDDDKIWKEVKDLGKRSIFVGGNTSFSVNASVVPGCEPNRVYFTNPHSAYDENNEVHMSVYSLRDDRIEYVRYAPLESSGENPPLWFMTG